MSNTANTSRSPVIGHIDDMESSVLTLVINPWILIIVLLSQPGLLRVVYNTFRLDVFGLPLAQSTYSLIVTGLILIIGINLMPAIEVKGRFSMIAVLVNKGAAVLSTKLKTRLLLAGSKLLSLLWNLKPKRTTTGFRTTHANSTAVIFNKTFANGQA